MAILIDTNVLIEIERRRLGPEVLRQFALDPDFYIAAITASELLTGAYRATSLERMRRRKAYVDDLVDFIPVISFDLEIADVHAQLWAELARRGTPIGPYDLLIAATARARDLAVLTDNAREFEQVAGLTVHRPNWPSK